MLHEPHALDEPLLTAKELSVLLGDIPSKTILQYAREGRLPCVRVGRHVRFVKSDVERALDAQRESRVIERRAGARAAAAARVRRFSMAPNPFRGRRPSRRTTKPASRKTEARVGGFRSCAEEDSILHPVSPDQALN